MKPRLLMLLLTLLCVSCGSATTVDRDEGRAAPSSEVDRSPFHAPPAQGAHSPPFYGYYASNGAVTLPRARGYDSLCATFWYSASNAHNGAATWPNGVPQRGGQGGLKWLGWARDWSWASDPFLNAFPLDGSGGTVSTQGLCFPFSNFENLGVSPPWQSNTSSPNFPSDLYRISLSRVFGYTGQGPFSPSKSLWQGNSFCYLESHHNLSHSSEYARVYRQTDSGAAGGFHWRLQVSGGGGIDDAAISGTGAEASCVSLNRDMHPNPYVIQTVHKNTDVALSWTDEEGVCLPMAVYGDADHGGYQLYIDSNHWWRALVDNRGISKIHVMCVGYADPWGIQGQAKMKEIEARRVGQTVELADEPEML